MELRLDDDDRAFCDMVRRGIRDNLPPDIARRVETGKRLSKEDHVTWQKILYRLGWMAPHWPPEHGGPGWTPMQCYLFEEELDLAPTPRVIPFGISMLGPVLMAFGNQAQRKRYLPRILSSDDWWCQGFSEPGSGSDLASLRTRAVADGESYLVNGGKTWTTFADRADMMFLLVRTDDSGRKQEGISFLLMDMKSPGITVRPIATFDGGAEINEVFFDDVAVPRENLVGEAGEGWRYARSLLSHERFGIAGIGTSKRQLRHLKTVAAAEMSDGRPLSDDPRFRDKIATVEIDLLALEGTVLRILSTQRAGQAPGPESSILKIKGTEIQQALTELLRQAVGYYANPFVAEAFEDGWNEPPIGPAYAAPLAPRYFNWRKASIYGGTNEIQKNIIAKMVLGL
jgi:alkylation response protein AidB-like acyl-CoA dehydrogenase